MSDSVRVAVPGAAGRMGRAVIAAVVNSTEVALGAAQVRKTDDALGRDTGTLIGAADTGVELVESLDGVTDAFDTIIDFSGPDLTRALLPLCAEHGKALVVGTTGFTKAQEGDIRKLAETVPVVMAPNFSVGVNVCLRLAGEAARLLGGGYDVEIVEAHHRRKLDAPSGTALALGRRVAQALDRDLDQVAVYGRQGQTGTRKTQTIGFSTVRGGDVIGEHTVLYLGDGERVEIAHKASSRANFARGALRAAVWLRGREPGLYDMDDVLGFTHRA